MRYNNQLLELLEKQHRNNGWNKIIKTKKEEKKEKENFQILQG